MTPKRKRGRPKGPQQEDFRRKVPEGTIAGLTAKAKLLGMTLPKFLAFVGGVK